jgi:hypothetical protein
MQQKIFVQNIQVVPQSAFFFHLVPNENDPSCVFVYFWFIYLHLQIAFNLFSYQKEKLQTYRIEIAKDARKAETLTSEFEASIYTPAMVNIGYSDIFLLRWVH